MQYGPGASSTKTRIETPEVQTLYTAFWSPGASSTKTRIETVMVVSSGISFAGSGREFHKNKD